MHFESIYMILCEIIVIGNEFKIPMLRNKTQSQLIMKLEQKKCGVGASWNSILPIKNFTWHTLSSDTLIYKKVVEVCRASAINTMFGGGEAVNRNF